MTPAVAEVTDVLATVEQLSCTTLPHPSQMTNDELSHVAKKVFVKFREYLPWIEELKERFTSGERDSKNHLKAPIDGCDSWKEYCTSILSRTPQAISKALGSAKAKQLRPHETTAADVAQYDASKGFARKLLTQLTPAETITVLVNQGTSETDAKAIVNLVVAENAEPESHEPESEEPAAEPELPEPEPSNNVIQHWRELATPVSNPQSRTAQLREYIRSRYPLCQLRPSESAFAGGRGRNGRSDIVLYNLKPKEVHAIADLLAMEAS